MILAVPENWGRILLPFGLPALLNLTTAHGSMPPLAKAEP